MPTFRYEARDAQGRTRSGVLQARDQAQAFLQLRDQALWPTALDPSADAPISASAGKRPAFSRSADTDEWLEDLLRALAALLASGVDMRTAIAVVDDGDPRLAEMGQSLVRGATVEAALEPMFVRPGRRHLTAFVAAGAQGGDLPSGLVSAADALHARRTIQSKLIETLSYPAFVFVSAMGALAAILLVVTPAIAPLIEDARAAPPLPFRIALVASALLTSYGAPVGVGLAAAALGLVVLYQLGPLRPPLDAWLLDGPLHGFARGFVFGGYARVLGEMIERKVPMTEALRLAQRTVANTAARKRLDATLAQVQRGVPLGQALRRLRGFPLAIVRLCDVGEATGRLGQMLGQAGRRQEMATLERIDRAAKIVGPALILALGALVGALMAGVLSALTEVGSIVGA